MTISQTEVRSRRPQAKIGALAMASYLALMASYVNSNPQAKQVTTLSAFTATNDFEYVVSINGVEVSYTADATATAAEVTDGIADAINANPLTRGVAAADGSSGTTVVITGTYPGLAFTFAEVSTPTKFTTTATTAAASAAAVSFGRAFMRTGYKSDSADELGVQVVSTSLVAQLDTLTVVYAAAETYEVTIDIDGEAYSVDVTASVDTASTCTAIAAAINAAMPANTVIASGVSGTTVTLTAEVAGKAFKTGIGTKTGTASRLVLVHTTASQVTDITKCLAGVSMLAYDEAAATVAGNDPTYPANAGVKVLRDGLIWVQSDESISLGDDVYVETTAGATAGRFYKSSSATRIKLPRSIAMWERDERSTQSDGIAVLRIKSAA